ncbi:MAG TPA: CHC2 zinc finger domain-containing protein [Terriglobales bacterium]|nr:CHC2 zinc finger domain-containing protein [Terriglobales bacterium]
MANPGDFASTVKQQADIVRVIGEYIKLKKSGAQNFTGLCPFHSEKTGSFSVHATRQFYHCFGCGASGDVFSFVQKIENITFPEAVRAVAQKAGIPLPKTTFSSPEEAREARQRGALLEIHEGACGFFQEQLQKPEGAHAREYLSGRGLNQETLERFRIGYAPDSGFLLRDFLKRDFDEETLRNSGLFSWKQDDGPSAAGHRLGNGDSGSAKSGPTAESRKPSAMYSKFRNRVLFPICNEGGRVIAFTGRTLATDEKSGPKYLNSPETPIYSKSRVLFNLDKAKEAVRKLDYAILVEGQMDCISVFAAGFHNVIASSGTAFTDLQARLLARFSHKIVVNFDPDTAGAAAAERSLSLLVGEDFEIKVLTLEQGFDPDLFIRRKGANEYAQALRHAPKYFDYLIERAQKQFAVRTPEGKVKAVNYLLPHIQRIPSRIVRDELANEMAQKLAIDSAVLRQELKHAATSRGTQHVSAAVEAQVTPAERILIRALASAGDIASGSGYSSSRDGADDKFDPARQVRFALRDERLHEGLATESFLEQLLASDSADVMSLSLSESNRRLVAGILLKDHEELTPELVDGAIHALRRRGFERRQREVRAQIADAERRNDAVELARLLRQKIDIDRALGGAAPGAAERDAMISKAP